MTMAMVQIFMAVQLALVPMTGELTDLAGSMSCLEDPEGKLGFGEVSAPDMAAKFTPSPKDIPNFGFTESVYWCQTEVENQTQMSDWVLEIGYPLLDYVDVYLRYADGGVEQHRGGDLLPFSERYRPQRTINFAAKIAPNEIVEIWVRVKTESSLQIPLVLKSEAVFGDTATQQMLALGMYYGVILVMLLYNGFICVSLKQRVYLYYVFFLAFFLAFAVSLNGVALQHIFPEQPSVANVLTPVGALAAMVFMIIFSRDFLGLEQRYPRHNKVMNILAVAVSFGCFGTVFFWSYSTGIRLATLAMLSVGTYLVVVGFRVWRGGFSSARIYLLGWGTFIAGAVLLVLKALGILPSFFLTDYGIQIGSGLQVTFFSLSLADRIRITQLERDVANQVMLDSYKQLEHELSRRNEIQNENDKLMADMLYAQEQLTQADKLSSLGQLTAGVAHDIASPTGYIANAKDEIGLEVGEVQKTLNDLVGDDPSEEARELREFLGSKFAHIDTLLTSVGTGTDRIKSIHQAIRNYTRVDAEPVPGQAIGPIVDEAATILSSKLKTFDLDVDLGDLPGVTCRRSQLGQVFANLLSNAADALQEEKERRGEEGFEGKVVVRGMAVKHGGQMGVVVRVEDNGPGIPADIRDKIREAFFTTKAVGKGTGLGMSICQRIIDAHGGTLVVGDSVEFGGASMIIWLPLNLDQERVDS